MLMLKCMVNMLRSTFELDFQTLLISMRSVSILCFCTAFVDVKWMAGCSIEHTLTHLPLLICT